jgi:hypothetical protein
MNKKFITSIEQVSISSLKQGNNLSSKYRNAEQKKREHMHPERSEENVCLQFNSHF